jgi:hypothetical protein
LFVKVEPLAGHRHVEVTERRTRTTRPSMVRSGDR